MIWPDRSSARTKSPLMEVRHAIQDIGGNRITSIENARRLRHALASVKDQGLIYEIQTEGLLVPGEISIRATNVGRLEELRELGGGRPLMILGRPIVDEVLEGYSSPNPMTSAINFREFHIVSESRVGNIGFNLEVPLDCIVGVYDSRNVP